LDTGKMVRSRLDLLVALFDDRGKASSVKRFATMLGSSKETLQHWIDDFARFGLVKRSSWPWDTTIPARLVHNALRNRGSRVLPDKLGRGVPEIVGWLAIPSRRGATIDDSYLPAVVNQVKNSFNS